MKDEFQIFVLYFSFFFSSFIILLIVSAYINWKERNAVELQLAVVQVSCEEIMSIFSLYTIVGVLLLIVFPCFCYFLYLAICKANALENAQRARTTDRQGNVFTVPDEASRDSRYNDIFYIEPNSAEAARIRAQLEKDDKDLPSYEEVIRMTNLSQPTAAPAVSVSTMTQSNDSVNTTDTVLSVPPYSEVDPYASTSRNATANDDAPTLSTSSPPPPSLPTTPPAYTSATVVALPITTPITTHTSLNV